MIIVGIGVVIVGFVAFAVAAAVFGHIQAKKRREALAALAPRLGLQYNSERDHGFASQYNFLDRLKHGQNRYGENFLRGTFDGHSVIACDYHYETTSTDSKGRRRTTHHHLAVFILTLPKHFPELTIAPEGIFSKIAQFVGYEDIDFESHEFSRKFCVRSPDKKFAFDFCNARMIEYLLANPDLVLEVENDALAFCFNGRMEPERIEREFNRLLAVRSHIPEYLVN